MKQLRISILATFIFAVICNVSAFDDNHKTTKTGSSQSSLESELDHQTSNSGDSQKKVKTIHLTKADFLRKVANYETNPDEWEYLGDKPAIIDFYADWCGPCKRIAPILEELADKYDGEIYIYKIDTEKEQELAAVFGIRSIPTLLFIPVGDQPQMVRGALPKESFEKAIQEILLKK